MVETARTPQVSVIIPAYNRAASLPSSIQSVLNQTFTNFELIVVDDGSTDETQLCVSRFEDPRIRYIRLQTNVGAAAARNVGIEGASGEWIAFQDSDDEWLPEKLEKQMKVVFSSLHPGVVVYCGFLRWKGTSAIYTPFKGIKQREGSVLKRLLLGNMVGTPTLLVPKACLTECGAFDEQLKAFEDWELAIRLAKDYTFCLIDEPLVNSYYTKGSISENDDALFHAVGYILQKHAHLYDTLEDSRFWVTAGFGLANLAYGKPKLAGLFLQEARTNLPRSIGGWTSFVFNFLLPNIYWRLWR